MNSEFLRNRVFLMTVILTVLASIFVWRSRGQQSEIPPHSSTTTLDVSGGAAVGSKDSPVGGSGEPSGRSVAAEGAPGVLSQSEVEGRLRSLFAGAEGLEFSRSGSGAIVTVMGDLRKVESDLGKIHLLLTELAGAYGVPAEQVKGTSRLSGNKFSELFVSSQTYQGLDVFGGGVQTTVNRSTGVAFLAGAYLYPIQQIDMNMQMSVGDAKEIVRERFKDTLADQMGEPRRVVYAMADPSTAELAYVFIVNLKTDRGPQVREVVVGFVSKAVVYERPLSYN